MNKYKEIPSHRAHTYACTQSSEQLCYIISWRPFVSSDVSGLQRHSGEEINIMSKSRFHACSGETLTSTVYYSLILKQSHKKNTSITHSAHDCEDKMVSVLFPQYSKHDFIQTLSQMDFLFSKTNQNNHGLCAH